MSKKISLDEVKKFWPQSAPDINNISKSCIDYCIINNHPFWKQFGFSSKIWHHELYSDHFPIYYQFQMINQQLK